MRYATLFAGLLSAMMLASCQGYYPEEVHDRNWNDTGMYGGHKGSSFSGSRDKFHK